MSAMKVITIGYSKTGTKSLDEAYKILGYRVSDTGRHMSELSQDWLKFFDGKGCPADLRRMYENYDAASDIPVFLYWKIFVEAFPNIKLVMTTRDVESWLRSYKNQIFAYNNSVMSFPLTLFSSKARRWFDFVDKFYGKLYQGRPVPKPWFRKTFPVFDDDAFRKGYLGFIEDVKKNAPADQLLILNFKDGWEPLCKFLGHEIPDVPFPHRNKDGSIAQYRIKHDPHVQEMFKEMYLAWVIIIIVIAVAIAAIVSYF